MSPSAQEEKKEIIIIGGGIIGTTTAYFLTHHPLYNAHLHTVTLLEASTIAGGASGKAGGLLALWAYPNPLVGLSYALHKSLAEEYGGAERWGYRGVGCGQVECRGRQHLRGGKDNATKKSGEKEGDKEHISLQKRDGKAMGKLRAKGVPTDLDWVDPEALRAYDEMGDPSTTAQVHPFQFTTAMAELARGSGADIREGTVVKRIEYSDDGKTVTGVVYGDKKNDGEETRLKATDVIIAAGPWTRSVYPSAPIAALRAHSVTIRPSREVSAYALFTQIKLPPGFGLDPTTAKSVRGSGEIVSPEIYARPNNEVYACGEGDHEIPLPPFSDQVSVDEKRCQEIIDHVGSISEELRDGEVTARQACYLPNVTASRMGGPLIGETGIKGLLMAAGHTCWGIQNGPGTGKLISEFVFDGKAKSADIKDLDPRIVL